MALSLYVFFALCFLGVVGWYHAPLPTLDRLREIAIDKLLLIRLSDVYSGVRNHTLAPNEYLIAASGALYYTVIVKTLLKHEQFARSPQDIVAVANSFML